MKSQPGEPAPPEHYVLLCARRYAEMARKLSKLANANERQEVTNRLSSIREAGMIEFEREYERRVRPYPEDFRKALVRKDGSVVSRPISSEESEMLRYSSAIPAFPSIEVLSAVEMLGLADMFEGWAQSDLTDPVNVARLLGWADGFRTLVAEVGEDYAPPVPPAAPLPLLTFMARKMLE